jgi:hypothetical protein
MQENKVWLSFISGLSEWVTTCYSVGYTINAYMSGLYTRDVESATDG